MSCKFDELDMINAAELNQYNKVEWTKHGLQCFTDSTDTIAMGEEWQKCSEMFIISFIASSGNDFRESGSICSTPGLLNARRDDGISPKILSTLLNYSKVNPKQIC